MIKATAYLEADPGLDHEMFLFGKKVENWKMLVQKTYETHCIDNKMIILLNKMNKPNTNC
jgi:hypothetical protein